MEPRGNSRNPEIGIATFLLLLVLANAVGCLDWKIQGAPSDGDGDADVDADVDADADTDADGDSDGDVEEEICEHHICDTLPQCGCGADGRCIHDERGDPICVPIGPGTSGEACGPDYECGAGMICFGVTSDPPFCRQYCENDSDCPGESICYMALMIDSERRGVTCTLSCDPTADDPICPAGIRCGIYYREETMQNFTHCLGSVGTGRGGSRCTSGADCAHGFFCPSEGAPPYCHRWCTLPDGTECAGVCMAFEPAVSVNGVEHGYCR